MFGNALNCYNIFDFVMKKILILFLLSWLLMTLIVIFGQIAFSAIESRAVWTRVALTITETAGKMGTVIIIVITVLLYTRRMQNSREIIRTLLRSAVFLFLMIGGFAFINEHLTKKATKVIRPSLLYIAGRTDGDFTPQQLYSKSVDDRTAVVMAAIAKHRTDFHHVDQYVLNHWSDETGYSFPSGHTFNAFLLATIVSFSLYHSRSKRVVNFYLIPPVWSMAVGISRVALGAHSWVDVVFGGAIGLAAGLVFIHWDDLRHLVLHRKYNA
jgi:phosphatidylglycerophosphatase B